MSRYAERTSVSAAKSRAEIEDVLLRYGAAGFGYMTQGDRAMVEFATEDRRVRFVVLLPDPQDEQFRMTPARRRVRTPEQRHAAWEQACRQRWRALALVVKAKLEAVETGITTFEEEFLAHIVMPDGRTVGEHALPAVDEAYRLGEVRPLLALPGGDRDDDR